MKQHSDKRMKSLLKVFAENRTYNISESHIWFNELFKDGEHDVIREFFDPFEILVHLHLMYCVEIPWELDDFMWYAKKITGMNEEWISYMNRTQKKKIQEVKDYHHGIRKQ